MKLVQLHFELLVSTETVGQAGRSHHGPVDSLVALRLQPELGLPHVVQHRLDDGEEEPPDEEHGLAPALLLGVPAVAEDQPAGGGGQGSHDGLGSQQVTSATSVISL